MELWMSGEIQNDVSDAHRIARKIIEKEVNNCICSKNYGNGLKEWAYVAIILKNTAGFNEIAKYSKKKKEAEFRLQIDHSSFLNGNLEDKLQLLSDSLIRSLRMMLDIGVVNVDIVELEKDVSNCLAKLIKDHQQGNLK